MSMYTRTVIIILFIDHIYLPSPSVDTNGDHTTVVVVIGQSAEDIATRLQLLATLYDEAQRHLLSLMATDNFRRFKKRLIPTENATRHIGKAVLDK